MDLTTANIDRDFDRLNLDVIEDLRRLMRMAEGAQKLDVDRFEDLMLKIEVEALTIRFQIRSLDLLWVFPTQAYLM